MPCSSDGYDYSAEANAATRAACEIVRVARSLGIWGRLASGLSHKTLGWVEEHDKADAGRAKEDKRKAESAAAAAKALKKLSKKEQEVLGL